MELPANSISIGRGSVTYKEKNSILQKKKKKRKSSRGKFLNKNAANDSFTRSGRARTKKLVKYDIPLSRKGLSRG